MTCPQCGAQVQPGDLFCMKCGHALNPAEPTRHLDQPVEPVYSAPVYAEPEPYDTPSGASYDTQPEPSYHAPSYAPPYAEPQRTQEPSWASGSSFPQSNPYGGVPNTVSRGTMLNGRPIGGRNRGGNSVLQGLGAAVLVIGAILAKSAAAIGILLAKFGAVIAGAGFFKLFFYWITLRWLFHNGAGSGLGAIIFLIIVLLIVGSIWRARMA